MIVHQGGVLSFPGSVCIKPLSDFLAESQLHTCLTLITLFLITLHRQPLRVSAHFFKGVDPLTFFDT